MQSLQQSYFKDPAAVLYIVLVYISRLVGNS